MNMVPFAFRFMSRNLRRILMLAFSIMLSLTLLIGTFLTVEYLGQEFLMEVLEDMGVDIGIEVFDVNISNYMDVIEDLEKIDGIANVEAVVLDGLWGYNITKDGKLIWPERKNIAENYTMLMETYSIYAFGFRSNFSSEEVKVVSGALNLTGNNVAITEELADKLKLKPGDNITFFRRYYREENGTWIGSIKSINATICAIIRFEGRLRNVIYKRDFPNLRFCFIISIEFAQILLQKFDRFSFIDYWVFVDYNKVLNPWTIDQSMRVLRKLEKEVKNVLYMHYSGNFHVVNWLLLKIENCKEKTNYLKFGFGFTILPNALLAFFFILTANQTLIREKAREIGLLRVRGATDKQIFLLMLIEGTTIGLVGGVLGTITGYLASAQFIEVLSEKVLLPVKLVLNRFLLYYFQIGLMLGVAMSILAAFISFRKVVRMETRSLLQEYLEEVELSKKVSKRTLILFLAGLAKVVEAILNISVAAIIASMGAPENFVVFLVGTIILFADLILIPLGPIFFIYGLTKIVTYYSVKFRKVFKVIVRPLLKELGDMVVKNFSRKPARTIKTMALISMVLVYGVTIVTVPSSVRQNVRTAAEIINGADVSVNLRYVINETQLIENLTEIEGVELISRIWIAGFVCKEIRKSITLIIVDENYFNVSYIRNVYLEGTSVEDAYKKFRDGGSYCLISKYLKDKYGYKTGDYLHLTILVKENLTKVVEFKVIGVVKILPGLASTYRLESIPVIVISHNYLQNNVDFQKNNRCI